MIRKCTDTSITGSEHCKGGKGTLYSREILTIPELGGHGRKLSHSTLKPGASVGNHAHNGDFEVYYIIKGTGTYNDNGTLVQVGPGDMTFCPDGECHGLENTGTEPLEFIAAILYTKA